MSHKSRKVLVILSLCDDAITSSDHILPRLEQCDCRPARRWRGTVLIMLTHGKKILDQV